MLQAQNPPAFVPSNLWHQPEAEKVEMHHGEGARCTEVVENSKIPDPGLR